MASADEFIKYSIMTLEVNFGQLSYEIINKVCLKKKLDEKSNINDFMEFIDLVETSTGMLSGKKRAETICKDLRAKANEINENQKVHDISLNNNIDEEINTFLINKTLPTESDIADYSRYITLKYGVSTKKIEKELIEKIKLKVKENISRKKIDDEIKRFLTRYPQPTQTDVNDFINYIHLLKLNFQEDGLRQLIEKERLFRKFHEPTEAVKTSELDHFVEFIKNHPEKKEIKKAMQKQELSYLIKDEAGVSDELLSEFKELATPNEKDMRDTLEGLGLKHLIRKK
ncbi:MAG: hypothetical protein FIB08_14735 [Candidatus Methanoperedens sp.]|nr:hypothetical protein [Candidatus Methanoperedens sp.]